ncbi:50S ribosomal protein L4 [Candidatus Nomurabacteria bacterium]|uniref:Large ribosomal subunit protein uL4 n=1 Tax=candidate division WWE3 bacterium TaxID=2053526 RepID=A0A955IW49_UNCKA|nr:50S ribosomal protein L4 [candidate division WWE3 bacterium]MCB9823783.1 50S ribosomal protein L4 [Candidatus Nomurabacteria bacterium]MCB9826811.1 50S ribosomal protein L4 [Candidatus Nomurabacteria bacterium]MCB9827578.1 50S ribosomal protein L4 [Candidatus Nomurabacteria bacterium]HXK52937.1 50S ribosomal protein L4 [bacterium]
MQINVINTKGEVLEKMDLDTSVFKLEPRIETLKQYVRVFLHNMRQGTSSTKTRAEVSGAGRKPWRQKGTGRARVGSIRSPLWRKGGIVHGPKPKSWSLKLTKKMKSLALLSALSLKVSKDNVFVVDTLKAAEPSTSKFAAMMKAAGLDSRRSLIILDDNDMNVRKSVANIPWVHTALVQNVNAYELMNAHKVIFTKKAVDIIQTKYKGRFK